MQHNYTNDLIKESSPYLLQHAHNPVNWQAWHPEVWNKAKEEDKLVIISIGYSACHWCHVMEHESFEDAGVAQLMNEHFICIKVDREERPDVDQIYMDAVQLISGRGGWPLNAIALPDGKPVYAGTYFPKENWKQVLAYFVDYWAKSKDEAYQRAEEITQHIKAMDAIQPATNTAFVATDRQLIFEKFDSVTDYQKGGRTGAPKFPMPVNYQYLLRNYFYTKNAKALQAVTVTLENMMNGGIYDHVGGGFARYSVDAEWEIPHFEKMLYDNSQLVSLYCDAYKITRNERYRQVVYETLEYIQREMTDASGGFYSAQDADSEGEEGKYYVWSVEEMKEILGEGYNEFVSVFNVTAEGNFEGYNHLTRKVATDQVSEEKLKEWKNKILAERVKRIKPLLDDKILTSWNALMLKGYVDAYETFGEQRYLQQALNNAHFIKSQMLQPDHSLKRNYKNGKVTINGFLDDHSFTCEAFIALYEATFNEQWLTLANDIAGATIQHFYDLNTGLFFYTSVNDDPLIARKKETSDNVIPSSNSSMAKALYKLGMIYDKKEYIDIAARALHAMKDIALKHPTYYANWTLLMDEFIDKPYEVAIVGEKANELKTELSKYFLPDCIFVGSDKASSLPLLQGKLKSGETWIYVCKNKACGLPVNNVAEALMQMR